jgi:hypothetical protein
MVVKVQVGERMGRGRECQGIMGIPWRSPASAEHVVTHFTPRLLTPYDLKCDVFSLWGLTA